MLQFKVDAETAEKDVSAWLDFKKVKPGEREEKKAFVETLTDALKLGSIAIDSETMVITQTLDFPIDSLMEIKYKARATTGALQAEAANVKGGLGIYIAYASVLSGLLKASLNKMDSEDFKILQAITTFFL